MCVCGARVARESVRLIRIAVKDFDCIAGGELGIFGAPRSSTFSGGNW